MSEIARAGAYKDWAELQDREINKRASKEGYGWTDWAGDTLSPSSTWTMMNAQVADMDQSNYRNSPTELRTSADTTDRMFQAMKDIADRKRANPNTKLNDKARAIQSAWQYMKTTGGVRDLDSSTFSGY